MILAILACEIGFWVFLVLGLITRYPLGMPKLGIAFLYSTPLIDLVLVCLVIMHLRAGAEVHFTHALAAFYIGFSVAFGHKAIAKADRFYQRRFLGRDVPEPVRQGAFMEELKTFGRAVVAVCIAAAVIALSVKLSGAEELEQWYSTLTMVVVVWFFFGPVWVLVFPKKQADREAKEPVAP